MTFSGSDCISPADKALPEVRTLEGCTHAAVAMDPTHCRRGGGLVCTGYLPGVALWCQPSRARRYRLEADAVDYP